MSALDVFPENDFRRYLIHSAKGTTWKDHKYIGIKNGRYIYPSTGGSDNRPRGRAKDVSGSAIVFKGQKLSGMTGSPSSTKDVSTIAKATSEARYNKMSRSVAEADKKRKKTVAKLKGALKKVLNKVLG